MTLTLILLLLVLTVTALWLLPSAAGRPGSGAVELVQGKDVHWWARRAVQNGKDSRARGLTIRRQKNELRKRWQPTVEYAYRLAATVYGVSESELRRIGSCESHHYPFARNGRYRGVMQEGPMFERGPFGRAGFSVYDPLANVLTAAHARTQDGSWRQWECASILGIR